MGINYGLFVSLMEEDGIPLSFLYCIDATFTPWACQHVNTLRLANASSTISTTNTSLVVLQTLKQTTQYNKYYIWKLKPEIQIQLNMALLELVDHESF
jgi:hypothetical protein